MVLAGSRIQHLQLSAMCLGKTNSKNGLDLLSNLIKAEEQKALKVEAKSHPKWIHLRTLLRAVCSCRRMFYNSAFLKDHMNILHLM